MITILAVGKECKQRFVWFIMVYNEINHSMCYTQGCGIMRILYVPIASYMHEQLALTLPL